MTEEIKQKEDAAEIEHKKPKEKVKAGKRAGVPKKKPEFEIWATGRRKTAVARVKMVPGSGKILINKKSTEAYFGGHLRFKSNISAVGGLVPEALKFDYFINTTGGGLMGQSEAIRLGMARAISRYNETFRPKLKSEGLLSRDPRMVERKKPGQPKARKKFQWTKR